MTYTAHNPQTFYGAVASRLSSQTSKNIGRAEAPSDRTLPYAVVYPLNEADDPDVNGTLSDAHETTVFEWQVTSVGGTAEQAEWMQHQVRSALLGWEPTVAGVSFGKVERSGGQGTRRDDGTQPAQFFAVDTFTVFAN
jgi:hypothetical protein